MLWWVDVESMGRLTCSENTASPNLFPGICRFREFLQNNPQSAQIPGRDRGLFPGSERQGLPPDTLRRRVEAVAVAVRAQDNSAANDRVTTLANLVG